MIHIEPIVIALRWFPPGDELHDPYPWSGQGVRIAEGVIEIQLCQKAPTPTIWRELHKTLKEAGWKKVVFKRYVNGERKEHTVDLCK